MCRSRSWMLRIVRQKIWTLIYLGSIWTSICRSMWISTYWAEMRRLKVMPEMDSIAVEHGNLEIRYEGKAQLIHDGRLQDEIECRLTLSEYKDRHVDVGLKRREDGLCVVIMDGGRGVEWKNHLKIDPARASDSIGRGIAQATIVSFDKVVSNAVGN